MTERLSLYSQKIDQYNQYCTLVFIYPQSTTLVFVFKSVSTVWKTCEEILSTMHLLYLYALEDNLNKIF